MQIGACELSPGKRLCYKICHKTRPDLDEKDGSCGLLVSMVVEMVKSRDIELKVGRRSTDGIVRLTPHPPALLQLSVSYKGERSASVVLTREQVVVLKEALTEYENEMPPASGEISDVWDKQERRADEPILLSDRR